MNKMRQLIISVCVTLWTMGTAASAGATVDTTTIVVDSTASTNQSQLPVTFGQVFVPGEIINPDTLGARLADGTDVPLQVDVKATHNDGSLRHAVLTARVPELARNSQLALTLHSPGNNASGVSVALADLLATNFDAEVSLQVGSTEYTASARDLLQSVSARTWLSGPLVSEWLVSGSVTDSAGNEHPHLSARFHVRAYAGLESVRVSVTVENAWSFEPGPRNYTYDAAVVVQGKGTVLNQTGVNHYRQARWRRVVWWGSEPQYEVAHETAYLEKTGVVPSYDSRLSIPSYVLANMESEWSGARTALMGSGLIYTYMPDGGGRPDIAPLPGWTARYLMTQDSRAKRSTMGTSEQAGSFSIHYRDRDTDLPLSIDTYPNATIMGSSSIFPSCGGNCSTPFTPDVSHQPSMSFVPYLVSGDFFHLEELQFWANWNTFYWGNHGGSDGLLVYDQVRAQAWGLRTLGHAAYITPDDDPLKAYFLTKVSNNLSWYKRNVVDRPHTPLGYMLNPPNLGLDNIFATWMDDFFTWTIGHLANLGFNEAVPVFDYKVRFPVGRMTNPDYCWILASTYWTSSRDPGTGDAYQTWADYKVGVVRSWEESFSIWARPPNMSSANEDPLIAASCDSAEMSNLLGLRRGEMIGAPWSHEGYPANLQPAVAIAAERGAPDGDTAWSVFDNRSVKPDSGDYDYNVNPQWAIVPGNVDVSNPGPDNRPPIVSLSANPTTVQSGSATSLSWSTSNATSCQASGDWSGSKLTSGSESSGPLTSNSTFELSCSNTNGTTSASVSVNIAAPGAPTITLSVNATSVSPESSVTLTWSSTNATSCSASGDWNGSKGVSGSEATGPLMADSSFTLTCSGAGGTVSETVSVTVSDGSSGGGDDDSGSGSFGFFSLLFLLLTAVIRRTGQCVRLGRKVS